MIPNKKYLVSQSFCAESFDDNRAPHLLAGIAWAASPKLALSHFRREHTVNTDYEWGGAVVQHVATLNLTFFGAEG